MDALGAFCIVMFVLFFAEPIVGFIFSKDRFGFEANRVEAEGASAAYQIEHDKKQDASDYDDPLMRRPLQ